MKLWSGRFEKETDKLVDDFNTSFYVDYRLYKFDILGSIAHCVMLEEQKILSKIEQELICKALKLILNDITIGKLKPRASEDIHSFVESELIKRIGEVGKKMHTARSRNDQVTLDLRLYLNESSSDILDKLRILIEELISLAKTHSKTIMPGYTHMQKAQPIVLGHHLMAYVEMFLRDAERMTECRKRIDVMPLGSGALAGTSFPIDRKRVADLLGFSAVTNNSMDAVSDRDYVIEFIHVCSLIMMHLSRFSEELIIWATDEFKFVTLDDRFATGSSIMPQKKNPDIPELIRGKTGKVYGDLMSMLTIMKGLPLAYNKDMQEDKEAAFEADDITASSLEVFTAMLPTLKFNTNVMRKGAAGGFAVATDVADYLVRKNVPFRDAHAIVGQIVLYCINHKKTFDKLKLNDYRKFSNLFDKDMIDAINVKKTVAAKKIIGGTAPNAVKANIRAAEKKLNKLLPVKDIETK